MGQASHHRISWRSGFEGFEDGMETEARIGPHANLPDVGRHIGKAGVEQLGAALPGSRVAATEFGVPQVGRVGFDAEQRVIGAFTAIARVVADLRPVLMAEDGDDGAVEIKDEPGPVVG